VNLALDGANLSVIFKHIAYTNLQHIVLWSRWNKGMMVLAQHIDGE